MKALLERQQQAEKLRALLTEDIGEKTLEQRLERCRHIQYDLHQPLFAVSYTTIFKAAAENSLHGVKTFLNIKHGKRKITKSPLEEYDNHGYGALHHAAEKESMDVLKFFIEEQHCDINMPTTNGETPFALACKANKLLAVEYLYQQGCDIAIVNKAGMNAIHFVAQSNSYEVIQLLSDLTSMSHEALEAAMEGGSVSASEPNTVDQMMGPLPDESMSITTTAEISSQQKVFLEVLNRGANNKITPLHLACLFNCLDTVQVLLQNHILINYVDSCQETALHKAARKGYRDIYSLLLHYGANEELKNVFRETPRELLLDAVRF